MCVCVCVYKCVCVCERVCVCVCVCNMRCFFCRYSDFVVHEINIKREDGSSG